MSDVNLGAKSTTPGTGNQNQVPFFIPGPKPPLDSIDPKDVTNTGAGSAPGAPNVNAKSEGTPILPQHTPASSIPPATTTNPRLISKEEQTSAKSAVSSKYVDMSQLKAELEDVRKMVSDVVNRLMNILERLQNLHAGNPATMAQIKRLKAATEKLLASADDVSNEVAGIERAEQMSPSVETHSGVSAPTQYTFGSPLATRSGTGNLAQVPTTSALPAKPTDPNVQKKIDEMREGARIAFSKLDPLEIQLKSFQSDDEALRKRVKDLKDEFDILFTTTINLIEEIDLLSANKSKQLIADVEKSCYRYPIM